MTADDRIRSFGLDFTSAHQHVAADQSVDEKSNVSYYVARARIAPASLTANPDIRLYPGMPAEVLIVHKPRSAIDYMVSPIAESLNRAFRED